MQGLFAVHLTFMSKVSSSSWRDSRGLSAEVPTIRIFEAAFTSLSMNHLDPSSGRPAQFVQQSLELESLPSFFLYLDSSSEQDIAYFERHELVHFMYLESLCQEVSEPSNWQRGTASHVQDRTRLASVWHLAIIPESHTSRPNFHCLSVVSISLHIYLSDLFLPLLDLLTCVDIRGMNLLSAKHAITIAYHPLDF